MSTLKVNTIQTTSGVEVYTCKAWVNFNGTGTVAIRGSGNVSSITDNGTGDYTVNWTTSFGNTNYAVVGSALGSTNGDGSTLGGVGGASPTIYAASCRVRSFYAPTNDPADRDYIHVTAFA